LKDVAEDCERDGKEGFECRACPFPQQVCAAMHAACEDELVPVLHGGGGMVGHAAHGRRGRQGLCCGASWVKYGRYNGFLFLLVSYRHLLSKN